MNIENKNKIIEGMKNTIQMQQEKIKRYEDIIHAIANIDTIFMLPDGSDREWDDKEALNEIEKLVKPVWDEHCENSKRKVNEMINELKPSYKEGEM